MQQALEAKRACPLLRTAGGLAGMSKEKSQLQERRGGGERKEKKKSIMSRGWGVLVRLGACCFLEGKREGRNRANE